GLPAGRTDNAANKSLGVTVGVPVGVGTGVRLGRGVLLGGAGVRVGVGVLVGPAVRVSHTAVRVSHTLRVAEGVWLCASTVAGACVAGGSGLRAGEPAEAQAASRPAAHITRASRPL